MVFESREHKINYLKKQNYELVEKIQAYSRKVLENQNEILRLMRTLEESGKYRKHLLDYSSKPCVDDEPIHRTGR